MPNDLNLRIRLQGIKTVFKQFNMLKRKARSIGKSVAAPFRFITRQVKKLSIAFAALIGLTARSSGSFEMLRLRLKTVTGSAKEADRIFNSLFKLSTKTPFDPKQLIETGILLRSFGQDGEDAVTSVAEASAATGRNIMDIASAIGSIETEPLRRLGIEVRRTGELAKITFRDKFGKELKTQAKGIDNIRKKLLEVFSEKFGGSLEEASKTLFGRISTLKGSVAAAFASIGDQLSPIFKALVTGLNDVVVKLTKNDTFKNLGQKFSDFAVNFAAVVLTMTQSMDDFRLVVIALGNVLVEGIKAGFASGIGKLKIGFIEIAKTFGRDAALAFIGMRLFNNPGAMFPGSAPAGGKGDVTVEKPPKPKSKFDQAMDDLLALADDAKKRLEENIKLLQGEDSSSSRSGGRSFGSRSLGLGDIRGQDPFRMKFNRIKAENLGAGFQTTSTQEVKRLGDGFKGRGSLKQRAQDRLQGLVNRSKSGTVITDANRGLVGPLGKIVKATETLADKVEVTK